MTNARGRETGLAPDRRIRRDVLVLIPAYNAGEALGSVVRETRSLGEQVSILVVDDGSTDATAAIARKAGAEVISHAGNLGKGAALRTGFGQMLKTGFAAVVTLDADGQHAPSEIPILIERWAATGADIIVGTRRRDPAAMPRLRILTNWLSSLLVSLSAGTRIDDSQSGFRLLSRRVVERVRTKSSGYGAESEILIKAARGGFKIDAAPVSTIYGDETSYVHPLKQPLKFTWLILKSVVWRFDRSDR